MNTRLLIAIVDDNPSVRRALERLCRSRGYAVASYESAEAYLESEVLDETDCLLLDHHMKGMSGLELQAELNRTDRFIATIFISVEGDPGVRARAFQGGAVDFLPKPVDVSNLLAVVEQSLGTERERR